MNLIPANNCGSFAKIVKTWLAANPETNQTSLAARLGFSESTFRDYLNDKTSPKVNAIFDARHGFPDDLLQRVLQHLADGRFAIESNSGLEASTASCLLSEVVRLHELATDVLRATQEAESNGHVCVMDQANVSAKVSPLLPWAKRFMLLLGRRVAAGRMRRHA